MQRFPMGQSKLWIGVGCVAVFMAGAADADQAVAQQFDGVSLTSGETKAVGERSGWMLGGSIGRGQLDIGVAGLKPLREALSVNAHAGVLLNPRLALVADGWMVRYHERDNLRFADSSDHLISETALLGGAQLWATSRLWLRAGVGFAWHRTDLEYPRLAGGGRVPAGKPPGGVPPATTSNSMAPAAGVALGFEIGRTAGFGFELILRGGGSRHEGGVDVSTTAISAGGTWY